MVFAKPQEFCFFLLDTTTETQKKLLEEAPFLTALWKRSSELTLASWLLNGNFKWEENSAATAKLCVSRKGEKATCVIPIIILKSIFPLHTMTVDNP